MTTAAFLGTGDAIDGMPSVAPGWDERFRHLTGLGNAAFHAGDDAGADALYRDALAEAERLLDAAGSGGRAILIAPMALTIAANNLAASIDRTGTAEAARAVSVAAVERLCATAEAVDQPLALRINCLRHLPHALAFMAEFAQGAEPESTATRLAERAADAKSAVMRVARLWPGADTASAGAGRA